MSDPKNRPWYMMLVPAALFCLFGWGAIDLYLTQAPDAGEGYLSGLAADRVEYAQNFPAFAVLGWSLAVCTGMLGAFFSYFRRREAVYAFVMGFAGFLFNAAYTLLINPMSGAVWTDYAITAGLFVVFVCAIAFAWKVSRPSDPDATERKTSFEPVPVRVSSRGYR